MFALRNRGGDAAATQLGMTLVQDTSSALLRHEVAYVLGQMQLPCAVPALAESLRRHNEHRMVRHESAEALGAIEFPDDAAAVYGAAIAGAATAAAAAAATANTNTATTTAATTTNTAEQRDALLREFSCADVEQDLAVRESCLVALDSSDYWSMFSSATGDGASQSFAQQKAGSGRRGGGGDNGKMPTQSELAAAHFNRATAN